MTKQLAFSLTLLGMALLALAFQPAAAPPTDPIFIATDGNEQWLKVRTGYAISAEEARSRIPRELGWTAADELRLVRTQEDDLGFTHYRYRQYRRGIKVEAAQVLLHERDRQLVSLNGKWVTGEDQAATAPALTAEQAVDRALQTVDAERYLWEDAQAERMVKRIANDPNATAFPDAELVLIDPELSFQASQLQLAYKVEVSALRPLSQQILYIDAVDGDVLLTLNDLHTHNTPGQANTLYSGTQTIITDSLSADSFRLRETTRGDGIETYNLQGRTNYEDAVDFIDEDNHWNGEEGIQNGAAGDAQWGAAMTFDYFAGSHGYIGVDGAGMPLINYIGYDSGYGNAFWNGRWATFGDGDGNTFGSSLATVDIVAHEFVHGVTDKTADLIYRNESGALNESFSDIFGALVEFYATPELADWFIGEDATVDDNGIRNMADPNTENDPDTYRGQFWFTETGAFAAGVHTNSGVQNYWFYLLTEGGEGINDNEQAYSVNGIGLEAAGAIAFRNLRFYLAEASTYADARRGALRAAEDLYGECSTELAQTANAWHAVGVGDPYPRFDLKGVSINYPAALTCGFPEDGRIRATVSFENCVSSLAAGKQLPIAFQVDDGPVVLDTVVLEEALFDGDLLSFAFQKPATALAGSGVFDLKVWPDLQLDNIRHNDTLRMTVDNVPQQNVDLALRDIRHPFSGCFLSEDRVEVAIDFLGCDSMPAGTPLAISYQVNGGTVITEDITTPRTLFRGEQFTHTFSDGLDMPQQRDNSVSAWLSSATDSLVRNDSLRNVTVANPRPIAPFGQLTFEGQEATVDSFYFTTGTDASLAVSEEAAYEGSFGVRITGGDSYAAYLNEQYFLPQNDEEIWTLNPTYNSTFCFCAQVPEVEEPLLRFSLRQRQSALFTVRESVQNRRMNALRVLVEGEPASQVFTPSAPLDANWYLKGVDLADYAGRDVEICFETHTGLAPLFDPFNVGDVISIDNIFIGDLALSAEDVAANKPQLSIFPNPAQATAQLRYRAPQAGEVQLRVLGMNGQRLLEDNWGVSAGENLMDLPTAAWPSGVYVVQLWQDGAAVSRRLVKL
ncbi:MAG: T9SS type A sorting domain-containing protein [Bacteroidetes bacterium]|jgi:Zn-dependent metalloprotease|nr:T9SS type A sorting domain-containing protein [Bacteroidota bacterium]